VITEDRAYFVPYRREIVWPNMKDILIEIFDLDDAEVYEVVEGRFSEGKVIVGSYFPSTEEMIIHTPLERSEYVQKRIKEVFGDK
jgi:hypothetical protein